MNKNPQASAVPTVLVLIGLRKALGCRTSLKALKWITPPPSLLFALPSCLMETTARFLDLLNAFLTLPFQKLHWRQAIRILYPGREVLFWSVPAASHPPGKSLAEQWAWSTFPLMSLPAVSQGAFLTILVSASSHFSSIAASWPPPSPPSLPLFLIGNCFLEKNFWADKMA